LKVMAESASGNQFSFIYSEGNPKRQPSSCKKRENDGSLVPVSKKIRSMDMDSIGNSASFELIGTYYSESPNRKPLRIFRYTEEVFVLKIDLLAVLDLKNTRFQHLQYSQKVTPELFKPWAKENHLQVGANIRLFVIANKSLVDLLLKFDETVSISKSLKKLLGKGVS